MRVFLSKCIANTTVRDFLSITVGGLVLAVNLNLFLVPAHVAPGGVSGISIILNDLLGWRIGLSMFIMNLPLMAIGFKSLGGFRFLSRTFYAVVLYNLGADLLSNWMPVGGLTDDLFLNALFGGAVAGVGAGLVYRAGGTNAGTGVLARTLQLRTGIPVSLIYLLTDGGIILAASQIFGWERGMYALITLFTWGLATDFVLEGPSVVRTVFIVTDQPESVTSAIFEQVRIGVTGWPAEGMFTTEPHTVLFCTVGRPMESQLRSVVRAADPRAFIVAGLGHQATGGVTGRVRRHG